MCVPSAPSKRPRLTVRIHDPAADHLRWVLSHAAAAFIARLGSALTFSPRFAWLCSVSALPLGAAFGLPVFALGVRRFTHPENRAFAFTVFYAVLCASSAVRELPLPLAPCVAALRPRLTDATTGSCILDGSPVPCVPSAFCMWPVSQAGGMVITFARSRFPLRALPWGLAARFESTAVLPFRSALSRGPCLPRIVSQRRRRAKLRLHLRLQDQNPTALEPLWSASIIGFTNRTRNGACASQLTR